ncbi:phytoene desaturase family protein [Bordetella genomosp. 4]|uniref:Pyridine nucleotide-disulfide oxidoreductase domain-containing protein 2 n=1 Tax=Bordetella genomosp. 4 TaxID=463044 RepID=A0A261U5X6_9BORD|nr:NAD(P)/FAD-dependent oxidoreductase [Bordetella genomosp. 4]OZI56640.1 FAD-dependent oxidoreductase [Bordetella genomosp. 4]
MAQSSDPVFDVIVVGSGMNSLVCTALLARSGRRVLMLEREAQLGGCIRTDELTVPGFHHDTLSTAHPLFMVGPAYAALGKALHEAGLEYCNTSQPTAVLLPDGRHLVLSTSHEQNRAAFEQAHAGDGQAYAAALANVQANAPLVFGLLGNELWRWKTLRTVAGTAWKQGPRHLVGFMGRSLTPASAWLRQDFKSDLTAALLAPWVLHCGLSPDAPLSSLMAQVVAMTLEGVGLPIVKGGNANTVLAFERLIRDAGGRIETQADVVRVRVEQGRATGVTLADGRVYRAANVVCNVTPTQLYGRLLDQTEVPEAVRAEAQAWRYGKGNMQIHLALDEAPQWNVEALRDVGYVHITRGVDAVSRAVNEAERGSLPAEPTICVAQPTVLDPTRAPPGKHILWVQLPECPRHPVADALGALAIPEPGNWTAGLRDAYADRIIDTLAQHIPNLRRSILGRAVLSPADLAAMNINLVGGDPYGGDCGLDQSFFWRPSRINRNHSTPVRGLWHIGASTHPGPGLGGTSGFHVASALGAT